MSLVSINFIIFTLAIFIFYYLIPILNVQKVVLLAANLVFYFSFGLKNLLMLFSMILISYICSVVLRRKSTKKILFISVIICIMPLLLFKYYNFSLQSLDLLFQKYDIQIITFPLLELTEPLGISFFTFKMLSYVCETYKGAFQVRHSFLDYAIYISFFPTITSGPIDAPEEFLQQLKSRKKFCCQIFLEGVMITLFGYFQKMIVADRLAPIINQIFGNYTDYRGFPLFITSVLYSFQIYLDFSGYTLIVIGIARALNIYCINNFEQPYFSSSIQEFWRRWHISLSNWLKTYIYIPLGGNRKGVFRKYVNLMITFFVSGIWHGAGWNFIFWGILHGCYQVIGNLTLKVRTKFKKKCHLYGTKAEYCIQIIITFLLVNFAWVIFWNHSLSDGLWILRSMIPFGNINFNWLYDAGISHTEIIILIFCGIMIWIIDFLRFHKKDLLGSFFGLNIVLRYIILYLLIFSILVLGYYGSGYDSSAFIYFQF